MYPLLARERGQSEHSLRAIAPERLDPGLQHECDHLDGIVYPMRMTDLSLLAYNDEPGPLAKEVFENSENIDPLFIDLVERWPGRNRWFGHFGG
jgi:hypothetical protein